jgi:hypothetical protein
VQKVRVGALAEIDQLVLDRTGIFHRPTFSMSVARGIDRERPVDVIPIQ